ncbi:MAG: hypothetical protein A3A98_01310 [Candidatus Staskawiczbacteria bacterium RIFCSPLOWO2_01_FULL_40_39]|uniref:ATP synthase subunit b n=1 Tax=Candidatus Staskawiczbacteria bacterium RIFCSPHIGHO2_01_FULL_39_25 TaxID=1802202 RepID=A0A1G2HPV6_9BACT|nr:MAG: hypothetical protein A2730_01310 [Candidatus Staskawiczbacteria bacterium RIFCSPHIGHO2_01_FULL_39_25]OGZ73366.1 MAG: hypothetical protein A3A98_01310 [Candidatus Staskawiczbacteria bacterium RIFCSPLOWO2_01_FULL_40_39]OGZ75970.1 MAG: hypothetical protein A3I87_02410 [Candidatus Staskawiczbacteria bacterium RIFCSPLOWO2_02_FULL_39_8]
MEEAGLLGQLGINWKLFLSQAFNFFILLLILRAFVYKPLLAVIKKRNEKIEEGLEKAKVADIRLKEIDGIAKDKIKQAELQSIDIIKDTEEKAKNLEQSLTTKAEMHQKELMAQIEKEHQRQQEESRKLVVKNAAELIRKFIVKTVELKPETIDQALIEKAVAQYETES